MKALRRAFTLIELMVAMAVLAVLVVMLLGLVDSASKLWRANESRVDAYRETRAALNIIRRDMDKALAGTNTNFFRANDLAYVYLADAEKDTNYAGALFFLTALPANAQQPNANNSGICQVGYFLGYGKTTMSPDNAGGASMNLYRYFLSSDATFAKLTNNAQTGYFNMGLTPTDPNVELLAKNVVGFRVKTLTADGLPYVQTPAAPLPSVIQIEITAVNQEVAKKLTSSEMWLTNSSTLKSLIEQNVQTFNTKVSLQNRP